MEPVPFHSTRWSLIARATSDDAAGRRRGLAEFCEAYWPPLFAFLRGRGQSPDDAADTVQGFLCMLLERESLAKVAPSSERGGSRFRSWLLTAIENYARDEHSRATAQKRGGGDVLLSLDADAAESRFGPSAVGGESPEEAFERAWALHVIASARAQLLEECLRKRQGDLFRCLESTLDGEMTAADRERLGTRLGLSPVALRVAIHRLRKRLAELIRQEVRQTVGIDEDPKHGELAEAEASEFEVLRRALE